MSSNNRDRRPACLGITWVERPLGDATLFSLSDVFTLGVGDRPRFSSSPGSPLVSEAALDVYTAGRSPLLQRAVPYPVESAVRSCNSLCHPPLASPRVWLWRWGTRSSAQRPCQRGAAGGDEGLWISMRLDFILGSTTPTVEEEGET
jgi:hypothetical protein